MGRHIHPSKADAGAWIYSSGNWANHLCRIAAVVLFRELMILNLKSIYDDRNDGEVSAEHRHESQITSQFAQFFQNYFHNGMYVTVPISLPIFMVFTAFSNVQGFRPISASNCEFSSSFLALCVLPHSSSPTKNCLVPTSLLTHALTRGTRSCKVPHICQQARSGGGY